MVQTDRQTPLSPLDYHYNVVEFSRNPPRRSHIAHWPSIDAILIVLATPGTGLGGKNRVYPSLRSCLGAIVW